MVDTTLLKENIRKSGLKIKFIAEKTGTSRHTLYNKINGKSEFTASEIVVLTKVLCLSKQERDEIFLCQS